jgi:hypothetical protein
MKAFPILVLALAVTAAGCGSDSPTPPTNNPPPGNTTTPTEFRLDLSPRNEKPNAVSNAEASASGTAVITIRITRDSNNNIVSAVADFTGTVQGFPGGSTITLGHIHTGDANTASSIVWNTQIAAGDVPLTNGSGTFSKTNIAISTDLANAAAIVANPAAFYFNIHSQANPGGVLRAQMNNTGAPADPGEPKPCDPTDPYCVPAESR